MSTVPLAFTLFTLGSSSKLVAPFAIHLVDRRDMAEFNLLSHLGVSIPAASNGLGRSAATSGRLIVLAPKEKPPRYNGGGGAVTRLAPTVPVASSRTPRVVVRDAPVPCNDCVNMQMAEARRRRAAEQRRHDAILAQEEAPFTLEDRHAAAPEEKAALRAQLEAAAESHRREKAMADRRDRADDRNQLEFLNRAAEQEEENIRRKREDEVALRDDMRRRAEETRAARRRARVAWRDEEDEGLPIGFELTNDQRAQRRSQSADMRRFWQQQIDEHRHRRQSDRERDRLFAQEADSYADRVMGQERVDQAAMRREAQRDMQRLAQQHADARRQREQAKALEREEANNELRHVQEDLHAEAQSKLAKQQALREDISRMISERKRVARKQHASERQAERQRAVLLAEAANEPVVMLRCPATGRILPPTAFNIPRTTWQAPSVTAFL
jgi:hypothetical protein